MKPLESVQMEVRRTWDLRPVTAQSASGSQIFSGGVASEALGYVRWRMTDAALFDRLCHLLRTEGYDQKAKVRMVEEVWTDLGGDIVRQREERTTDGGKEVAEAVFWKDRIELTRTDVQKHSVFSAVNPAGGMAEVQRRFRPIEGSTKEFLRLDALAGTFHRVKVERTGRFRGTWGGDAYDGTAYRFTVDGRTTTLLLTPQNETVQIGLDAETNLVLSGPTKSRRKRGFLTALSVRKPLPSRSF